MTNRDEDFKPKLGISRRGHTILSSLDRQVMRAIGKSGGKPRYLRSKGAKLTRTSRYNAHGRGAKLLQTLQRGWKFDSAPAQGVRRVNVMVRYVKAKRSQRPSRYAQLRYLQRDGVNRDGKSGKLYSHGRDGPQTARNFLERSAGDPHQFHIILEAEDGVALGDLEGFTRALLDEMERDLETRLDWVAVDHHNTAHPHTHLVIRGITDTGRALYIAGDYIAYGIRQRASEILTRTLGLKGEQNVEHQLEVESERFTELDRNLIARIGNDDRIDLRSSADIGPHQARQRCRLLERLRKLEGLGLAEEPEAGRWTLAAELDATLKALGERGDIIKTIHQTLSEHGLQRSMEGYAIHLGYDESQAVVGRVIGKGPAVAQMADRMHLLVDGVDGQVHYAEMAATEVESVRIGAVVELGREPASFGQMDKTIAELAANRRGFYEPAVRAHDSERSQELGVRLLCGIDLDAQVRANGATWLDSQLVAQDPIPIHDTGFGHEALDALARRRQWLIDEGMAWKDSDQVRYRGNLLTMLSRRELTHIGQELAQLEGKSFRIAENGDRIHGHFRDVLELVSGKYAVVETLGREFTLIPWRPDIEHELGRNITAIMRGDDGISWELGRSRTLGIGL